MLNFIVNKINRKILLFITLLFFGAISLLLFFTFTEKKFDNISINHESTTKLLPTSTPSPSPIVEYSVKTLGIQTKSTPTPSPTITASENIVMVNSSTPTTTPQPAVISGFEVKLSINGNSSFPVSLQSRANQCDVLSKALEQGKISSLNMKYDETYKTYGVYQINGIGKENSVWWVYMINSQSASQGCSYIKANNGDNIEWKYIGS